MVFCFFILKWQMLVLSPMLTLCLESSLIDKFQPFYRFTEIRTCCNIFMLKMALIYICCSFKLILTIALPEIVIVKSIRLYFSSSELKKKQII